MSLLLLLWWASLAMAGLAICWAAGLILARVLREQLDKDRAVAHRAVTAAFLAIMSGDGEAPARLRPYERRARLLAETLLELLGLVRGVERERLIASLKGLHVDDRFRSRLSRGSQAGRIAAAEALEAFPSPQSRVALEQLYRNAFDPELRIAAVRALIEIGAPPSIESLLLDLERRRQTDSPLYGPVLKRLVADSPDEALAALERTDFRPAGSAILAEAIGASGDYRAVALLAPRVSGPHPVLRAASVRALGVLGHPAAEPVIVAAIEDPEWEVRSEACEAAGRVGSPRFAPLLLGRLTDETWWVRFRAAEALVALGAVGIETLRDAARSPIDIERRAAAMALAERGLAA